MTPTERLNALQGLLKRIQHNAAQPRPARVEAASQAAEVIVPSAVVPTADVPRPAHPAAHAPAAPVQQAHMRSKPFDAAPLRRPVVEEIATTSRRVDLRAEPDEAETPVAQLSPVTQLSTPFDDVGDEPTVVRRINIEQIRAMTAPDAAKTDASEVTHAPLPTQPPMTMEVDSGELEVVFDEETVDGEGIDAATREAERLRQEEWRLLEEEAQAIEAAEKAEAERLEALRLEDARLAALKAEEERLAREAAARAETERLAKEAEAARLAKERAEQERIAHEKAEQERIAHEKAEEEARIAREKAEQERIAREKAEEEARVAREKEEAERRAREEKERAEEEARAKAEAERLEREAKEKAEQEKEKSEEAPISARQPRDEMRPDEGLDEEDEQPPESGEVASQRKPTLPTIADEPTLPAITAMADWEENSSIREVPTGPPPSSAPPTSETVDELSVTATAAPKPVSDVRLVTDAPPAAVGQAAPLEISAAATRRATITANAASFVAAAQAPAPASFGELLDASLSLGD